MKYSVSHVVKIAVMSKGQTRQHSTLMNFPRKKQIRIHVNNMDCDTADDKQENLDEIWNKMTSWREHSK